MSDCKFIDKMSISYILNEFDVSPICPNLETESDDEQVDTDKAKNMPPNYCKLHNKPATICKGCIDLFKQDPEKYKCPRAVCPLHLQQKHRCKGCNKTSSHHFCKLHNQRKVVCSKCTALFKEDPEKYKCPTGMCEVHFKRKCRCGCKSSK